MLLAIAVEVDEVEAAAAVVVVVVVHTTAYYYSTICITRSITMYTITITMSDQ